jgi:hypothetical protein
MATSCENVWDRDILRLTKQPRGDELVLDRRRGQNAPITLVIVKITWDSWNTVQHEPRGLGRVADTKSVLIPNAIGS